VRVDTADVGVEPFAYRDGDESDPAAPKIHPQAFVTIGAVKGRHVAVRVGLKLEKWGPVDVGQVGELSRAGTWSVPDGSHGVRHTGAGYVFGH
jgi:hypothetical protein